MVLLLITCIASSYQYTETRVKLEYSKIYFLLLSVIFIRLWLKLSYIQRANSPRSPTVNNQYCISDKEQINK